jgi:DNA modification methylase
LGIPWRVAFALQESGWILRQDIIWHKPNPIPESVKDRCTKSHEYIFLFSLNKNYYYNYSKALEPATYAGKIHGDSKNRYEQNNGNLGNNFNQRNMRDVWSILPDNSKNKIHYATFPEELARRCLIAGCPENGTVLDPFCGSGTTLVVAKKLGMKGIGIEINEKYAEHAKRRIKNTHPLFN